MHPACDNVSSFYRVTISTWPNFTQDVHRHWTMQHLHLQTSLGQFGRTSSRNKGFPGSSGVKNPTANAGNTGNLGLIPGSGRSPGGGNAPHSSILAWEIPWTEEPGRLQSMQSPRVTHDWLTEHNKKMKKHTHFWESPNDFGRMDVKWNKSDHLGTTQINTVVF